MLFFIYISNYLSKNYPEKDFFFGSVKKHWGVLHGYKKWKLYYSWGFYSSHSCGFYIKKMQQEKMGTIISHSDGMPIMITFTG